MILALAPTAIVQAAGVSAVVVGSFLIVACVCGAVAEFRRAYFPPKKPSRPWTVV